MRYPIPSLKLRGSYVHSNGIALYWVGMSGMEKLPNQLSFGTAGTSVALVRGSVVQHSKGRLDISSGGVLARGPFDYLLLDTRTGFEVSWCGMHPKTITLDPGDPATADGRVEFQNGVRVRLSRLSLGLPEGPGNGWVRLNCLPQRSLARRVRRVQQMGGAHCARTPFLLLYSGSLSPWPPPERQRKERLPVQQGIPDYPAQPPRTKTKKARRVNSKHKGKPNPPAPMR